MNSTENSIRLGVIGMSAGNGHPYSWSAIFNGYDANYMKDSPFPGIFEYLEKQHFPEDSIKNAKVTHIWTQDISLSEHIAKSSHIPNIVANYNDMIGQVDGILLARDDAENHYEMCKDFVKAGLPIFIDKPFAYNLETANQILALQQYPNQIFTCSSLRYANELMLNDEEKSKIGEIRFIDAVVPKSWNTYAVHVIEPILNIIGFNKEIEGYTTYQTEQGKIVVLRFSDNITCVIKAIEKASSPISIMVNGSFDYQTLIFKDSFNAFKASLQTFINVLNRIQDNIPVSETLKVIDIIEKGNTVIN